MVHEHRVDRRAAEGTDDGHDLRRELFRILHAQALGDLAHQGQEHRRGLLAAGVLAEEVGGRLDLLGQRRTHRVVAGLRRVVRGGFAAEGEDFDTGHQGVHVPDRLALAARDVGDGTEDDAGGDRHLDQHRQRPEAADATGNGGAEGMQAVRRLTAGVFLEGGGGRAGDFQQRSSITEPSFSLTFRGSFFRPYSIGVPSRLVSCAVSPGFSSRFLAAWSCLRSAGKGSWKVRLTVVGQPNHCPPALSTLNSRRACGRPSGRRGR